MGVGWKHLLGSQRMRHLLSISMVQEFRGLLMDPNKRWHLSDGVVNEIYH